MLIDKVRDCLGTSVSLIILMDDIEQLSILSEVIVSIGKERCTYEIYKDEITAYMMELRMPYNRYFAMMRGLQKRGWNIKAETVVDVIHTMYKEKL